MILNTHFNIYPNQIQNHRQKLNLRLNPTDRDKIGRTMNYKITEQYAREEEELIAELDTLQDANLFITKKLSMNEAERKKLIYRQYVDEELLKTFNPENITVTSAQYADGDLDITQITGLLFEVILQNALTAEKKTIARFQLKDDALSFIVNKCETDHTVCGPDLFFIFEGKTLCGTLNRVMIANQKDRELTGSDKRSLFQPSPRLIPPGFPKDNWNEDDDLNK